MKRKLGIHALTMARRNLRSYAMLSVTIILSLTLLLGYMVYSDSDIYNGFKPAFSQDRHVLWVHPTMPGESRTEKFLEKAAELGELYAARILSFGTCVNPSSKFTTENGQTVILPDVGVNCLSGSLIGASWLKNIRWLDGQPRDGITVRQGELVMEENMFYALGLDRMEKPEVHWTLSGGSISKGSIDLELQVVGTFRNQNSAPLTFDEEGRPDPYYSFDIYVSTADLNPAAEPRIGGFSEYIHIYTGAPEEVAQLADQYFPQNNDAVVDMQNAALPVIRSEKQTKAVIAAAMLLILGINLYSSFTNALSDRKFEIGVKRAIGASSFSIVRQFLYESLLVMLADILLSVVLVMDGMLVYKVIYEATPDEYGYYHDWIIYISPYSIAMFAVCAITLTVVFSLIFAYKSTQVEIVEYLKAE